MATSSKDSPSATSTFSLVKYETPILVTSKGAKPKVKTRSQGATFPTKKARQGSAKVARHDLRNRDHTAELLDTILPPSCTGFFQKMNILITNNKDEIQDPCVRRYGGAMRDTFILQGANSSPVQQDSFKNIWTPTQFAVQFEESGNLWIQSVSKTPATRLDVVNLQERLDMKLSERQARELGICPVRRELYDQCFDELIRQETLNCTERGLLLLRVRDELRMTVAAYETLYESSIAFGIRKALLAERGKYNVEDQVRMLMQENVELREKLKQQEMEFSLKQDKLEMKMAVENQRHADEVDFLKKTNNQLKAQLKAVVGPSQDETEAETTEQEKRLMENDVTYDVNPSF